MSGITAVMADGGSRGIIGRMTAVLSSVAILIRTYHEIDPTGEIRMNFIATIPTWAIFVIAAVALLGAFFFSFVRYTSAFKTVKKHAVANGKEIPEFGIDYKIAMALDTGVGGLFAIGIGVIADLIILNFILSNYEDIPMVVPIIFGIMFAFIVGVIIAFVLDAFVIHDYFNGKADDKITEAQQKLKEEAEKALASEEAKKAAYKIVEAQAVKYGITEASVIAKINDLMETEGISFVQAYSFLSSNNLLGGGAE